MACGLQHGMGVWQGVDYGTHIARHGLYFRFRSVRGARHLEQHPTAMFFNRGNIARMRNDFAKAAVEYNQVIRLCELDDAAHMARAAAFGSSSIFVEAQKEFATALYIKDAKPPTDSPLTARQKHGGRTQPIAPIRMHPAPPMKQHE